IVRPPPHGLSRGKRALSTSRTRAPARERRYAAVDPAGPAPTTATSKCSTRPRLQWRLARGGVPERPKGTGCKPVGSAYGGSNPPAPISQPVTLRPIEPRVKRLVRNAAAPACAIAAGAAMGLVDAHARTVDIVYFVSRGYVLLSS